MTLRWLRIVATAESVSLVIILTNRFLLDWDVLRSIGGPVHGFLYLATIAVACSLPIATRAKWLSAVPAIGGFLALLTHAGDRRGSRPR